MLLASLACGGLSAASLPGGILEDYRKYVELRVTAGTLSKKWAKPLITCNTCMASLWGSLVYWLPGSLLVPYAGWYDLLVRLVLWPFAVLGIACLNHVTWWLYLACAAVHKKFQPCPRSPSSDPSSGVN